MQCAAVKSYVSWVVSRRTRSCWVLKETGPGKSDARLGSNWKNTIHSVYAASSRYPGKERTIAEKKKIQVKIPHQRSPCAMKFDDRSRKRLKDNSDVPEARRVILLKNMYKLKRKRQSYILLARGGMGTPGCVNKRAGGKKVCGRCRS